MYTSVVSRAVTTHTGGVYDLGYHVVWCPKYRRPVLTDTIRARCEELIRAKATEHGWDIVALEIMPDQVHLFVKPDQTASPAHIANQFKGFTSRHLRAEFPELRSKLPTLWSRSYFVASVGAVSAEAVRRYIDTQYERPWRKTTAAGA
jgi:REP-associated tyrosine transposase